MVQLKPTPENSFICPICLSKNTHISEIRFESVHVLADCSCAMCGFLFYHVLPVGHTVDFPLSIGRTDGILHHRGENPGWLAGALLKSHLEKRKDIVSIEKIIYEKYEKVVILNTLDSLYGHVLLKLYNAFYHLDHQKDVGLVLIIPKIFKWLIPKGCAEAWVVDLKLEDLVYGYESIEKFTLRESKRFQEIYLSKAYSHPDFSTVDIKRLTGVRPFALEKFSQQQPTITFVLREDRWWFNSVVDYWYYRTCRKLNILSWAGSLLTIRQNRLVKRVIKLIKAELPDAKFNITGLGTTGSFNGYAKDDRQIKINAVIETEWCRKYAQSHVVVGIHGSNMLLPTAFAAGCVEILPPDRYGNMVQDLSVKYNDRRQLFFYRFADQYARPMSVAGKVNAMIRDFDHFNRNMVHNTYPIGASMTALTIHDDAGH